MIWEHLTSRGELELEALHLHMSIFGFNEPLQCSCRILDLPSLPSNLNSPLGSPYIIYMWGNLRDDSAESIACFNLQAVISVTAVAASQAMALSMLCYATGQCVRSVSTLMRRSDSNPLVALGSVLLSKKNIK